VLLFLSQSNWFNIISGILFNENVVYFSINIYTPPPLKGGLRTLYYNYS